MYVHTFEQYESVNDMHQKFDWSVIAGHRSMYEKSLLYEWAYHT